MIKLPFQRNNYAPDGTSAVSEDFSAAGGSEKGAEKTGGKLFTGRFSLVLSIVLFTIGVLFFSAQSFGLRTWGGLTMDEMVFHLTAPMEGTESTVNQTGNSWNEHSQLNTSILNGIDIVKIMLADRQADGSLPEVLQKILKSL